MDKTRFLEILQKNIELMEAKHGDYNSGNIKLEDYFPFGSLSYVQMLHVKQLRLVSLLSSGAEQPNFESIADTVRDMVNYAVFFLDHLEPAMKPKLVKKE